MKTEITYSVNNSIEIIDLLINEFDMGFGEDCDIILEQLKNINKKIEKYNIQEQSVENKKKVNLLNSFYVNYNEIKKILENGLKKDILIKLPKEKEDAYYLIKMYQRTIEIQFEEIQISTINMNERNPKIYISKKNKLLKTK